MSDESQESQLDPHSLDSFKSKELKPGLYRFAVFVFSAILLVLSNGVVWGVGWAFKNWFETEFPPAVTSIVQWMTVVVWLVFNFTSSVSDILQMGANFIAHVRSFFPGSRDANRM